MASTVESRRSRISTRWPALDAVHNGPPDLARTALERLLVRYRPAVARYLRAAVRDEHAADDLFQEFALRLTRGDFRSARPDHGRFRDVLKTVLVRLVIDHRRKAARDARLPDGVRLDAAEPDDTGTFLAFWRAELLDRAWDGLRRIEQDTGRPLFTVLRRRADHPGERSDETAAWLAERLGRAVTAGWARKRLMEARGRFTDLVVDEVAASLDRPTRQLVAEELAELGLLTRCREALGRWPGA